MVLLTDLVSVIADVLDLPYKTVLQYSRHLREAGLLSQKGRGRGAAHVTPRDGAILLLGVTGSTTATHSVSMVNNLAEAMPSAAVPIEMLHRFDKAEYPPLDLDFHDRPTAARARRSWKDKSFADMLTALIKYSAIRGDWINEQSGLPFTNIWFDVSRVGPPYRASITLDDGDTWWLVDFDNRGDPDKWERKGMGITARFSQDIIWEIGECVALRSVSEDD